MLSVGKIKQIIGPVVDVYFGNGGSLPEIFNALELTRENGDKLVLEVSSTWVKTVCALWLWTVPRAWCAVPRLGIPASP